MLYCFNPTLGQIWTNPAVGVNFYITFLTQKLVSPYLTQSWVETTHHSLECTVYLNVTSQSHSSLKMLNNMALEDVPIQLCIRSTTTTKISERSPANVCQANFHFINSEKAITAYLLSMS